MVFWFVITVFIAPVFIYMTKEGVTNYYLVANMEVDQKGKVAVFGSLGQLLGTRTMNLTKGYNRIQVPFVTNAKGVQIITLYAKDQLAFSQKVAR